MAMRTHRWTTIALLVGMAGLTACGSNNDNAATAEKDAPAPVAVDGEAGAGVDTASRAGLGALPAGEPIQDGRSIIATADLTLEVEDARDAAGQATDAATAAGGFLAQQEARPGVGVVTMTLRIPSESFDDVLGRLEALGAVESQRVDTQDVTEQVVDVESRIASARVSVARMRDLLEQSGDVVQLATVEGELSRREADLEALLGRQRVLDDQVAMATIRLDLREPAAIKTDADDALPGFLGGLENGWGGFLTAASVLVTLLGYALPYLALLAILGGFWLKFRHRRPRPEVPPAEPVV